MRANTSPFVGPLVVAAAVAVALVSALPYAGGWNDGSRLATVECLVDYHTFAIDRSIFVAVPPGAPQPYPPSEPGLLERGTGDKLFIDGHYYSDKSPVPAVLLAGVYQLWQWSTGLTARARPDLFCYVLTVASSGLAYVVAVWCVYLLTRRMLPLGTCVLLTSSFALATLALPYARHVNNHIFLLAVAAGLQLLLLRLGESGPQRRTVLAIGTLGGLGYAIDLGAGPVLLLCSFGLVCYRCRAMRPAAVFLAGALPWLVLNHALNYAVGGTFKPANAVPAYFGWPGSSFNAQNLTGAWHHRSVGHFLTYALDLLFGKRGLLGHDLPLFLALFGGGVLLWRRCAELPELVFALAWAMGTWLIYAMTSRNYSGLCCSIRWFVPLLAPGYYVLTVLLRYHPELRRDLCILSSWGTVIAALMWWQGPWMKHMVPLYWPLQVLALGHWLGDRTWRRQRATAETLLPQASRRAA